MLEVASEKVTFGGGELGVNLRSRTDLARHPISCEIMDNFTPLVEGAATRTPGTRFVLELRDEDEEGKLVPLKTARAKSLMLCINDGYARVLKGDGFVLDGGVPYEFAVPFAEADLDKLRWAGVGDALFIAWGARPKRIFRNADDDFTVEDYDNVKGPLKKQNVDKDKKMVCSDVTGAITIEANFDIFHAGHVDTIWRFDEFDLGQIGYWEANEENVLCVAPATTVYSVVNLRRFRGNVYAGVSPNGTAGSFDAGPNAPEHEDGEFKSGAQQKVIWRFVHGPSGYARITAVSDARNVTAEVIDRLPDSCVYDGSSFGSDTGTQDVEGGYRWYEPAWNDVDGWPDRVFLHEQSLVWGRGDEFWKTIPADFFDFTTDETDASSLSGRMVAPDGTLTQIEWMLSSGVIVMGGDNFEWIVRAPGAYEVITYKNIRALPDQGIGSAAHIPAVVAGGVSFINTARQRLFWTRVDRLAEALQVEDLTTFARHILAGKARAIAWQREPHGQVWVVLQDGTLRALTFDPRQQALGWSRQTRTNAFFEDVACKPDTLGERDEVWLIVRRTIDGATRRYVEKLAPFFTPADVENPTAAGAWFLDSALLYEGAAATEISGLDHLIGQEVGVFANGAMRPRAVVDGDGKVTLNAPATSALIGIPLRGRIRTLAFEPPGRNGSSRGDAKSGNNVVINYSYAAGGKISCNGDLASDILPDGAAIDGPRQLVSGQYDVSVLSAPTDQLKYDLDFDDALPFTLTGLTPEIDISEGG